MNMGYVYVLHFDSKLSHAEHYVGCTHNIFDRLTAHANGAGSRLTQVLRENGFRWRLGALGVCPSHASVRRVERNVKKQHNAKRYCEVCAEREGFICARIPGSTPFPLEMMPFDHTCDKLATSEYPQREMVVRLSDDKFTERQMMDVQKLMQADKDALGFIPIGHTNGFRKMIDKQQVVLALHKEEVLGYCMFDIGWDRFSANIVQTVVRDDCRLFGFGRRMLEVVSKSFHAEEMNASVADDLPANDFWKSCGFEVVSQFVHDTSGRKINRYKKELDVSNGVDVSSMCDTN